MDDYAKILIETEQRSKSNAHRLDGVERKVEDLHAVVTSIKVLSEKQDRMDTDLQEIKSDVKTLTDKPAKKWESAVRIVIETIIGGLVIWLLAKLGVAA